MERQETRMEMKEAGKEVGEAQHMLAKYYRAGKQIILLHLPQFLPTLPSIPPLPPSSPPQEYENKREW